VAALVGVKPSVLRFWETQFRSLRPDKSRTNQRIYSRKQVERALAIKRLLYDQGYTIAGARRKLRDGNGRGGGLDRALVEKLVHEVEDLLRLVGG
jgi:DNA-binding transcriptional MerR regulator